MHLSSDIIYADLSTGERFLFPNEIQDGQIFGDNDHASIFACPDCQHDILLSSDNPYQLRGTIKSLWFGGTLNWILLFGAPDYPSKYITGL